MEADQLVRIVELELCDLRKEPGDDGGVALIKVALGGFQFSEKAVGILESGRHGGETV